MAYETTKIQDDIIISKKFERGAAFATTEEATIASMSPVLDGMRVQSQGYVDQADSVERLSVPLSTKDNLSSAQNQEAATVSASSNVLGSESTSTIARNMDKSDEKDPSFFQRVAGDFGLTNEEGKFSVNGVFDSTCIPCGLRLDNLDTLLTEVGIGYSGGISEYLSFYKGLFAKQLQQLQDMLSLFTNTDPYIDMCAFIKFLTEFVCVPDMNKMISALMALMGKVNFEFGGMMDIIIQLVGPLLSPFLGNLVGTLEMYMSMIIKPIQCIIDSIQALIAKLDYNVLFTNIHSLDKHIDMGGPKKGASLPGNEENEKKYRQDDPRGDYVFRLDKPRLSEDEPRTPWIDGHIARRDIVEGERFAEADFNMAGPVSTWIDSQNAKDQKAIDNAAEELAAIRRAGRKVDGADPDAIAKQRAKEKTAEDKYRGAIEKRNTTYIGRANKSITSARESISNNVSGMKSSLIVVIGYLREAIQAVQGFLDMIFSEFKKLMGEYVGGSGGFIGEIIKKNALVQIIGIIKSVRDALVRGAVCEEDAADIKVESWIPEQQGMKIWTDEEGGIHIESDKQEIINAVDALVEARGVEPPGGVTPQEKDKGDQPDTASQKLKSLIEFTGDPVLDSEIARMTEQLVTPINVVFKCPLNTSVAQTEQINQWIKEVNS